MKVVAAFLVGLMFGFTMYSCANIQPPKKMYIPKLYQPFSDTQTIERKQDDGVIDVVYCSEPDVEGFVCMPIKDWGEQLKYEELLKKQCQVWK